MAVVKQFGMFNVNKAADHLIPAENEKWLHCCRGGEGLRRGEWGPSGCDYAWLSSLQEDMYKCPAARLHYLCELIIRPVRENIHFTLLKLIRKKNKKRFFNDFFCAWAIRVILSHQTVKEKKNLGLRDRSCWFSLFTDRNRFLTFWTFVYRGMNQQLIFTAEATGLNHVSPTVNLLCFNDNTLYHRVVLHADKVRVGWKLTALINIDANIFIGRSVEVGIIYRQSKNVHSLQNESQ